MLEIQYFYNKLLCGKLLVIDKMVMWKFVIKLLWNYYEYTNILLIINSFANQETNLKMKGNYTIQPKLNLKIANIHKLNQMRLNFKIQIQYFHLNFEIIVTIITLIKKLLFL